MEKNEIKSEETKNLTEKKETESKENESKPIEKLDETPKKTNKNDLSSKNANENEKKNIFIYFNVAYEKSKKFKIYLSEEYKGFNTLEKIEEKELKELNDSLILQIYRFQFLPEFASENENDSKKKCEFIVFVEEENSDKHQYIIKVNNLKRDFYEYNFKIEKIDILPLKYEEQFVNYSHLLRDKYKKLQGSKENEEFISSSQNLLIGNNKKFDFLFYLSIFLECFKSPNLVKMHLLIFKPDKINGLGELSEFNIKPMKNILNKIAENPDKINVEENSKERSKEIFFSLYLYFNLNYQRDEVIKMFDDENKCKYLLNSLITYHKFFEELLLPKEIVIKLMEKVNDYNKIVKLLFYLVKDCAQFLQVIIEKHELISKCFNDNKDSNKDIDQKNKHCLIDIEEYVEPKREDDIKLILGCFEKIKENNIKFIKFSSSMLEKYFEFYEDINPMNLLLLKQIISIIKGIDKNFEFKLDNIINIIHNAGLKSVKNGNLKNMELLEFIKGDEYYMDKKYNKNNYRVLNILDGIDIDLLKKENKIEDFLKRWKEMNFDKIFEFQQTGFLKKISSLIKEMNDFELFYPFFNISKEKELRNTFLIKMQEKYKEIISNFNFEKNDNFIDQTVELIYFSDKNKVNIDKFLTDIIPRKFDIKTVNEIYIKLTQKYDLSKQSLNIIIDYFTKNKQNSNNLKDLILQCDKIRNDILSNIDTLIIKEEDFFNEEETENYKFFKEMVDNHIITKKENKERKEKKEKKESKYIKETKNVILSLQEKIKKLDISYNSLKTFIKKGKNCPDNNGFKNRLQYIFLLDQNESEKYFENLKSKMIEIRDHIKDLQILLTYFSNFLSHHHSNEIKKINEIISDLKKQSSEKERKKEFNEFSKYFKKLKKYELRVKSIFFNAFYIDEFDELKKKNEKAAVKKAENHLKKLSKFFEGEINDKVLLKKCLKIFKKQDKNEIMKELDLLSKLLNIDEKKYNEKKDNLINDLLLLLKREYLLNTSEAIKNFLEKININDDNFSKEISNIIIDLKDKININIIKSCKKKLKDLNIDIDKDDSDYIDLLISFNEQPELITFLLKSTPDECQNLQELAVENDNSYISVNDIFNMEKCIDFFKCFNENKSNAKGILDLLKIKLKEKHDILFAFKNFITNYSQIKILQTSLDKSEVLKYKIQKIFNGSIFILSNDMKSPIKCKFVEKEESELKEDILKDKLISLRERAQLSKNLSLEFKLFIEIITKIINISNILEKIYEKGYPNDIIVNITIKVDVIKNENKEAELNSKILYYIDNNKQQKNYKELVDILKKKLSFLKSKQIDSYKEKPLIRYLYGRQFKLLYDYIKCNNKLNNNEKEVKSLLKYITNDLFKKNIKNGKVESKGNEIDNIIEKCNIYLNDIIAENDLTIDKIYETTFIKQELKKDKYQGIYIYLCEKLEKDLYQIYKYMTGNNPIAQNILLCNKITTNEQITAFLYRAILCEYNSCFIVGGIELLNNSLFTLFFP